MSDRKYHNTRVYTVGRAAANIASKLVWNKSDIGEEVDEDPSLRLTQELLQQVSPSIA